jgi:hypothetical protein
VCARNVEDGRRAERCGPIDDSRTIRRHDHVARVEIGMTQPIPRRQAINQGKVAGSDMLWKYVAGAPRYGIYPAAERGDPGSTASAAAGGFSGTFPGWSGRTARRSAR